MWLIQRVFNSQHTLDVYWIVLLAFALYLMLNRKNMIARKLMVSIGIFLVFYPIWHYASATVFYRLWWLFPIFIILALGIVKLLESKKSNKVFFTVLLLAVYLLVFGNNIVSYLEGTRASNIYHIEQNVIDVADLILEHDDGDSIIVVSDPTFMTQIRLYSARFCWGYSSRNAMMQADKRLEKDASYRVATALQTGYFAEGMDLIEDLNELEVDYVILRKTNSNFVEYEQDFDYFGETDEYLIYKLK